jgi:hypothetical protein
MKVQTLRAKHKGQMNHSTKDHWPEVLLWSTSSGSAQEVLHLLDVRFWTIKLARPNNYCRIADNPEAPTAVRRH